MKNNGLLKEFLTLFSVRHLWARRVGHKRQISTAKMLADVPASPALLSLNSALFKTNDADTLYELTA